MKPGLVALCLLCPSSVASALSIDLPNDARETLSRDTSPDSYLVPTGVFADGALPQIAVEGEVRRSAFRVETTGVTPLQILAPLRAQLQADGFEIILDCAARDCGGFDFRFATEILDAPDMIVNLRSFRFVSAVKGPRSAPDQAVTLLVSVSAAAVYIQIIRAGDLGGVPDQFTREGAIQTQDPAEAPKPVILPTGDLVARLLANGRAVLDGLSFQSGDVSLGPEAAQTLQGLADFLSESPSLRIALVGHSDSTGALDANTRISKARADVVRRRLIEEFGVDASRIEAHGIGFLAPLVSNQTDAGRLQNRRVEAVLLGS